MQNKFHFEPVFKIKDAEVQLKASVVFEVGSETKPADVRTADIASGEGVTIPFELFARLVAAVDRAVA